MLDCIAYLRRPPNGRPRGLLGHLQPGRCTRRLPQRTDAASGRRGLFPPAPRRRTLAGRRTCPSSGRIGDSRDDKRWTLRRRLGTANRLGSLPSLVLSSVIALVLVLTT